MYETLFFFILFSVCSLDCIISINLQFVNSFFSASSNLLLSPPSDDDFYICFCSFQLQNFYLLLFLISVSSFDILYLILHVIIPSFTSLVMLSFSCEHIYNGYLEVLVRYVI